MTLNVDKKNALKAWREADNKGKQMLENLYGKEIFANQNVMDRIKTFIPISLCLLPLSLSAVRIAVLRLRMRVAGLAFVIKHANLRNIRQNNLLTFGKTSR